mmetsp:Transcript_97201/g.216870  ORF Transcript_97201/g.216870 Transcript_97201/m.216870 type:complete len:229 (+) Transcript_97201:60-746(+)
MRNSAPARLACQHMCCGSCLARWEEAGIDDGICPSCPSSLHGFKKALKDGVTLSLQAEHARPRDRPNLWERARDHLQTAVALDKDKRSAPLDALGTVRRHLGDLEGACVAFLKALEADPKDARAHCGRGDLLQQEGDFSGAVQAYQQAVQANPRCAHAYNCMGTILHRQGDLKTAADAFRKAYEKDPTMLTAMHSLGAVYLAQGETDSARAAFRTVMDATKPMLNDYM